VLKKISTSQDISIIFLIFYYNTAQHPQFLYIKEAIMLIGVPKEVKTHEYRVGLVPGSVRELTASGHKVIAAWCWSGHWF
jgi:hypothetical protein